MAFSVITGHNGNGSNKTSATSLTASYTVAETAGTLVFLGIATDNINTTGGTSSTHLAVSDNAGNTYTKVGEYTNAAAAAAASTVSLWYSILRNATTTSNRITMTFSSSVAAKAYEYEALTIGTGSSISVEVVAWGQADLAAAASSTLTLVNREHYVVRMIAVEDTAAGGSTSANYSSFGNISTPSTTGGSGVSNIYLFSERRIFTGTSSTSAPTISPTGDHVWIHASFYEVVASSPKFYGFIIGA